MKTNRRAQLNFRQDRGAGSSVSLSAVGLLVMFVFPWMVYQNGAGPAWFAIGAVVGFVVLWQVDSYRLIRFSLQQKDRMTIPGFLSARFGEHRPRVRAFFGVVLSLCLLLFIVFLFSGITEFAGVMFGLDKIASLVSIMLISIGLLFIFGRGGLRLAENWIAFLILVSIVLLNFAIGRVLKTDGILENIFHSWAAGSVSEYVNVLYMGGTRLSIIEIISLFSLGFLVLGNPLSIQRFQQVDKVMTVHKSRRWGIIFSMLSLFFAVLTGGMLRASLYPARISSVQELYKWILEEDQGRGFIFHLTGLVFLLSAALLALDLLQACVVQFTLIVNDDLLPLYSWFRRRRKARTKRFWRFVVAILAEMLAVVIAFIDTGWVFPAAKYTFIIVSCGLAPVIILSLHYSKMTARGCVLGFLGGSSVAAVWMLSKCIPEYETYVTLQEMTKLAPVIPAMGMGFLLAKLGSASGQEPSKEVINAFEEVHYRLVSEDADDEKREAVERKPILKWKQK